MSGDRIAIVTGAARGIGAVIARELALRQLNVMLWDIDVDGKTTADELVAEGLKAQFRRCDVTSIEQVQNCFDEISSQGGAIEVLVNNAGWTPHEKFLEQDPSVWEKLIAINYSAVLNTCYVAGRLIQKDGAIVNVASDGARVGVLGEAVYAGAKAAVIGFSKSLAIELSRQGVRVNVVSPGSTLTPLLKTALSEEAIAKRVRNTPLGRLGDPLDIAHAVTFLALDATHITGQILSVNGGATRVG